MHPFSKIKITKIFDLNYVKTLDYKYKLEYIRDRSKLLEKTIFNMQMEVSKFFQSTQTKVFSGSLERNKIKKTFYINQHIRIVAFVDKSNSKCKIITKVSNK